MAPKGGRANFASLVGAVGDNSPVDRKRTPTPYKVVARPVEGQLLADVPVGRLVANPRNPRDELGDLSDLATIVDRQLQPGTVVSRAAWLKLWPEDEDDIGTAEYIVVNGNRRLAAAQKYGRPGLDVVLRDSIATDRGEILWAATSENIDRRDFDVLEEAKAVELMVSEFGSADAAAKKLGRSKGWVSQRRALLKLAPELQAALRAGDLAVRQARSLARVPLEEQVAAWQAAQNSEPEPEVEPEASDSEEPQPKEPASKLEPVDKVAQALKRLGADPDVLAAAVRKHFTDDERRKLIDALELR
ncbi:chromosome partitioning protein parb [Rhodococcus gordoniae]|uniref:Chromosome partitioning protein parb n=1 Tax=Rhodococcus gordoniae TaxID=223392 RepID=A0A379PP69_9NOCA|nr:MULTISPECIES: peptide transporter [Rhodococcus]UTT50937.1 peptide transporter [Rhodococcus gordoniae]SUF09089.1 chromosome partitioning protein parb [Rhodococcus gordoniae]